MHLAITSFLLVIGAGLLVTVLAEREQELSYYGITGDGRATGSSSVLDAARNNNKNPVSGNEQNAEPPESGLPQVQNDQQLLPFELLLPRLMSLSRHRFLPAAARELWLAAQENEDNSYGPMLEEDEDSRGGMENRFNTVEKCKSPACNMLTVKRDRTPILSIQAPIESLRQRIQWELRKKQEERNRKILDSIKRKLHYD